ncbi:MAG: nitroreductase family protein [Bacillota bacterium]
MIDLIKRRKSIRTYKKDEIEKEKIKKVKEFINDEEKLNGPLDNKIDVRLVKASKINKNDFFSYGYIKNPEYYIVGITDNNDNAYIDLGYILEKLVLYLTELNIGTCWLGTIDTQDNIKEILDINEKYYVPACISIGKIDKPRLFEKFMKFFIGLKNTSFKDFYLGDIEKINPKVKKSIKLLSQAPSSINSKPWRILNEDDFYYFYIKTNSKRKKMNKIDLGIGMYHFETVLKELGITGMWYVEYPRQTFEKKDIYYMTTFKRN